MQVRRKQLSIKRILFILTAYWFSTLGLYFYNIAWGTGAWVGEFSVKWGILFTFFSLFLLSLLYFMWLALWHYDNLESFLKRVIFFRQKLSFFRWVFALILLLLPVWVFQYTLWGLVFKNAYFRLLIWVILALFLAILFTQEEKKIFSWSALVTSTLLSGVTFTIASVFSHVSDFPFNLYWSDGNRIWDYSIMFGRDIYNYPADQPINAFISPGRQFVWGLPFLLPNTTILFNRFWSALVLSLPSAVLGWIAFGSKKTKKGEWLFLGLWAFIFLNQGPVYTPLVLSAILVAIAWRRPLWLALPLVAFAGYYAEAARWTWVFAPAIWAGMLSLSGSKLKGVRLSLRNWLDAILLGLSGISIWAIFGTIPDAQTAVSQQALLWYRLLPNETYPVGVLGGLLIAVLPLIILLGNLLREKYWQPSLWQKLAMLGSLLAFLGVGITISTKIGGGSNLHNLDMFLIALLFVTAIAWQNGGREWFSNAENAPLWMKTTFILLLALPAFASFSGLRPNLYISPSEVLQIQILTGRDPLNSPPVPSLPSDEEVEKAIADIGMFAEISDKKGEVLFIDVRQLLTFNYVPQVRLVPEYEKKRMMEASLIGDADYFADYYEDLANHRFSLIITEPLKVTLKNDEGAFSEEGDSWAIWVAAPTLCFYEKIADYKSVYVQILVPRREPRDCSAYLTQ